ncbi:MAG: DUF2332 domain-containing protein, partial [Microbacterium sp.]|uniref:DUF2332 family protein n=1 Tax=Microbacterium sp. TaxID=51671 RepID=UPI0039E2A2C4
MDAVATPEDLSATAARYDRFAGREAPGRSELYRAWAQRIATEPDLTAVVAGIPATHRQPPLVFAVMRLLGAPEATDEAWAIWLREHGAAVHAECARRRVQTNEPLRCAALMPALAGIPGPIALIEVGASAGLCLYPDRYSYVYETDDGRMTRVDPAGGASPVVLRSRWHGETSPPVRLPHIVWRAGIDLAPLDPRAPDTRAWLTGLVWPGETGRVERIARALDIAAADPPLLVEGDAASDAVTRLAARAPADATVVVTTPGVLVHVPRAARAAA